MSIFGVLSVEEVGVGGVVCSMVLTFLRILGLWKSGLFFLFILLSRRERICMAFKVFFRIGRRVVYAAYHVTWVVVRQAIVRRGSRYVVLTIRLLNRRLCVVRNHVRLAGHPLRVRFICVVNGNRSVVPSLIRFPHRLKRVLVR